MAGVAAWLDAQGGLDTLRKLNALRHTLARDRREDRDLVFGAGKGLFSGWSRAKEVLDARLLEARATPAKKANDNSAVGR
jgi:hypothetical protein